LDIEREEKKSLEKGEERESFGRLLKKPNLLSMNSSWRGSLMKVV